MRSGALFLCGSVVSLMVAAACGGEGGDATTGSSGGVGGSGGGGAQGELPCDINAFVKTRCQMCHAADPQFGAAMPLVTLANLRAVAPHDGKTPLGQEILKRLSDPQKPMPQPPAAPATAAEIAMMTAWVNAGTPARAAGDTCGGGAGGAGPGGAGGAAGPGGAGGGAGPGGAGGAGSGAGSGGSAGSGAAMGCTPDIKLTPSSPWLMPEATSDEYTCYKIDVAVPADRHIVAIQPKLDNTKIVHHLLLFQVEQGDATAKNVGATAAPCAAFPAASWKVLYAWGPGTGPHILPPEAGYRLAASKPTSYVLQVHYSNLQHKSGQMDSTGIEMCTESPRKYDADVIALGSIKFAIPPNTSKTLDCVSDLKALSSLLPVKVFQTWPHMHLLGNHLSTVVEHADGTTTTVSDKAYDFNTQLSYPVDISLNGSDKVRTKCTWNNSTGQSVSFGEATANEMCFNFLSYYPKLANDLSWLALPASASCK